MATWVWILIAVVIIVIAVAILMGMRQRTAALRQRFGPEYDRAVETQDSRRAAEADLHEREKQRAQLDIRPLPEGVRAHFSDEWQDVQEHFVDEPSGRVVAADRLVTRVMEARGYPMGDFDAQAGLISVDHPDVVENYRYAHGVHDRAQAQRASTDELRQALLRYRSLFDELLRADDNRADADPGRADLGRQDVPSPRTPLVRHQARSNSPLTEAPALRGSSDFIGGAVLYLMEEAVPGGYKTVAPRASSAKKSNVGREPGRRSALQPASCMRNRF